MCATVDINMRKYLTNFAPRIAALLDFESASFESYPVDLMVTLLAWCFGAI